MMKKSGLCFLLLVLGMILSAQEDYWRVITEDHIRQMSTFERAQYQKGLNLLNNGQFRSAASEFERFVLQFNASAVRPYMIFMRAYALYRAKDRNRAISVFNEVVDFYPRVTGAAAPSIYYRGLSYLENGDYAAGMRSMKELTDNEDYREHRTGAAAALQLVRNYWRNREPEKAAAYLKTIFETYREKAPKTAERARNYYIGYCMSTGRMQDYQSWYMEAFAGEAVEKKISKDQFRVNMGNLPFDLCYWQYHWIFNDQNLIANYRGRENKGPDPLKTCFDLLVSLKPFYEKADAMWDWYSRVARLAAGRNFMKPPELEDMVSRACRYIESVKDDETAKDRQEKRFEGLAETLIQANMTDLARRVNAHVKDAGRNAWNEYEILRRKQQWKEALAQLERIKTNFRNDQNMYRNACNTAGWIYRDVLKQYDDAVKAYREAACPPGNLWDIVVCCQRKQDVNAAIRQLIEIENAFPNEGPRAAWTRADYYRSLGNAKMAVKEGRYIMKKYPKSQYASYAHQLLEKYGIEETGGGVIN